MKKKNKILKIIETSKDGLKEKEICEKLDIKKEETEEILNHLRKLGKVIKYKEKYILPEHKNWIVGKLSLYREGYGFVDPLDGKGKGIFIPATQTNYAMDGDLVAVVAKDLPDGRKEGKIIEILERRWSKIVGKIIKEGKDFYLVPEDRCFRYKFKIINPSLDLKEENYAVGKIVKYPSKSGEGEVEIIEDLGEKSPKLDVEIIIKKYDLLVDFPAEVLKEAEKIKEKIPSEEIEKRKDLREQICFTIDGESAKDFDDAVSIEKLPNGNYRLYVHIADVSYYVKEGSHLDKEAYKRGTSVYFPDRVLPMLPEKLSNNICSLNPYVDRLTFTCEMEINKYGHVVDYKIYESVIKSKGRLTYTFVQKVLDFLQENKVKRKDIFSFVEKHKEDFLNFTYFEDPLTKELKRVVVLEEKYLPDIVLKIYDMYKLAKILYKKRYERGALDFELPEPVVILNEYGEPTDIYKAERWWSHRIIEEFMIVANETVAEYMFWSEYPCVYRVHEAPDRKKIRDFLNFVRSLGYNVSIPQNEIKPKHLQKILEKVKNKPEEKLINYLLLRTQARAKYSPENIGHFGLASSCYSHFTSPIRRYADLTLHRLIKKALKGEFNIQNIMELEEKLEIICKHITEKSIIADEAEREVIFLKQLEYAKAHIGEEFEGIITKVIDMGVFVELVDTLVPGFIHVKDLKDDYYVCIKEQHILLGVHTGKKLRVGDRVIVRIKNVDLENKLADFELVKLLGEERDLKKKKKKKKAKGRKRKK